MRKVWVDPRDRLLLVSAAPSPLLAAPTAYLLVGMNEDLMVLSSTCRIQCTFSGSLNFRTASAGDAGWSDESLLQVLIDRLTHQQKSDLANDKTGEALVLLRKAAASLHDLRIQQLVDRVDGKASKSPRKEAV
ncbi:MAG: hypothetical protein IT442_04960 [Phycisphaeraceae bacterium]|nr:hypothetical protein [Phycisphaeraceae bacterium]